MVGGQKLTKGIDYNVSYFSDESCTQSSDVKTAGIFYAKITGDGSNYTGDVIQSFTVKKAILMLSVANMEKVYGTPDEEVDFKYAVTNGYKEGDDEDNVIITGLMLSILMLLMQKAGIRLMV